MTLFKKPLLFELLFFSALTAFLHLVALRLYLYWTVPWFDIPMHFLGGFVIGLLALYLFYVSDWAEFPKDHLGSIFTMTLGSVLLVGLGWELWELFMGLTDALNDLVDTFVDLVMDILGGIAAFLYGKRFVWQKK